MVILLKIYTVKYFKELPFYTESIENQKLNKH